MILDGQFAKRLQFPPRKLGEAQWLEMLWAEVVARTVGESGLDCYPDGAPAAIEERVLDDRCLPGSRWHVEACSTPAAGERFIGRKLKTRILSGFD